MFCRSLVIKAGRVLTMSLVVNMEPLPRRISCFDLLALRPFEAMTGRITESNANYGQPSRVAKKAKASNDLLVFEDGARSWTRTSDPLINSPLVNQYVTESLAKLDADWRS